MLVPFGTHVVDREGKSVGTVSRLVLDLVSQEVVALVVQLAGLDLFDAQPLKPMPDHWKMPLGFDQRSLFLVAGDGWRPPCCRSC